MAEADIMRQILVALGSRPDVRLWRANAGVARPLSDPSAVVRYGVPGQADLTGILTDGRRLEIEVKSATGRLTKEQRAFGAMVQRFGGVWIVARSVDEAVAAVEAALQEGPR